MKNLEYSIYTYKHRKAIFYLIDKLITDNSEKKEILKRCQDHDMDKMYMYTYMDKKVSYRLSRSEEKVTFAPRIHIRSPYERFSKFKRRKSGNPETACENSPAGEGAQVGADAHTGP